jgi:hypothetical protein
VEALPELKLMLLSPMGAVTDFMVLVQQLPSIYRDKAVRRKWKLLINNYHA